MDIKQEVDWTDGNQNLICPTNLADNINSFSSFGD
jgi:hypothetical protein